MASDEGTEPEAESKAEAVVSKRAYVYCNCTCDVIADKAWRDFEDAITFSLTVCFAVIHFSYGKIPVLHFQEGFKLKL